MAPVLTRAMLAHSRRNPGALLAGLVVLVIPLLVPRAEPARDASGVPLVLLLGLVLVHQR